jgi:hypothetical protein
VKVHEPAAKDKVVTVEELLTDITCTVSVALVSFECALRETLETPSPLAEELDVAESGRLRLSFTVAAPPDEEVEESLCFDRKGWLQESPAKAIATMAMSARICSFIASSSLVDLERDLVPGRG